MITFDIAKKLLLCDDVEERFELLLQICPETVQMQLSEFFYETNTTRSSSARDVANQPPQLATRRSSSPHPPPTPLTTKRSSTRPSTRPTVSYRTNERSRSPPPPPSTRRSTVSNRTNERTKRADRLFKRKQNQKKPNKKQPPKKRKTTNLLEELDAEQFLIITRDGQDYLTVIKDAEAREFISTETGEQFVVEPGDKFTCSRFGEVRLDKQEMIDLLTNIKFDCAPRTAVEAYLRRTVQTLIDDSKQYDVSKVYTTAKETITHLQNQDNNVEIISVGEFMKNAYAAMRLFKGVQGAQFHLLYEKQDVKTKKVLFTCAKKLHINGKETILYETKARGRIALVALPLTVTKIIPNKNIADAVEIIIENPGNLFDDLNERINEMDARLTESE